MGRERTPAIAAAEEPVESSAATLRFAALGCIELLARMGRREFAHASPPSCSATIRKRTAQAHHCARSFPHSLFNPLSGLTFDQLLGVLSTTSSTRDGCGRSCPSRHGVRFLAARSIEGGVLGLRRMPARRVTGGVACLGSPRRLTNRWSARVRDKVPSSYNIARAAQLNR